MKAFLIALILQEKLQVTLSNDLTASEILRFIVIASLDQNSELPRA